ncbi:MAG: transglutaminaseTgpA domain-containing protein [Leptolyngbyaceae cyanobacterium MO_188.B28]|nr:transglutaminaseTgpA domain-containing protein [Leptolyngbyaceae cyanobacterium MO_188.B28]
MTSSVSKTRVLFGKFQKRLNSAPTQKAEDSVLLRILVQLLVTLGICSIVVASADISDAPVENLLAIPLSALGAAWSWYRRRHHNTSVKFCIAIGMLVALAVFFVRLLDEPGDTRLVLAALLIQLQVLHSFDLPRRKDLGYSIMIGLILIGVAATVSQTLVFGPLLLLFFAIALPVLALDYRSRLGLLVQGWKGVVADLEPRRLGWILLITLGLGLIIFAFLPRLPGYQIRTFPVSSNIEFDRAFDGRSIVNPGYVREGSSNGTTGGQQGTGPGGTSGQTKTQGPGEVDDTFYYGFNQRMNQNLRGALTPKVVMRVRSQAEGFWRVLAFDRYTGQGWEISRNEDSQVINRSFLSYEFLLPRLPRLGRKREVIQTYTMVSDLPNLIPALDQAKAIYFPTDEIAVGLEGDLRSPVGLTEGLTYTVVSEVALRNRTALGEAPTDYSNTIRKHYLQIPPEIEARVRQRAEELLAKSPKPIVNPYEKALFLAQALKQNYSIQPELPYLEQEEDLVEAFLFKYEGGYPDHFSTVLTVMLRSIGIPTRLTAGFSPGQFNPFTGFYIVRNTDAYALTEVYFPKYGWFAFDPIPGHELIPPSITDHETFGVLRQFWNWVAGWLPSPIAGFLDGVVQWITAFLSRLISGIVNLFSRGWVGALLGAIYLIGIGFIGWLGWSGLSAWRRQRRLNRLPPMEGLYQRMLGWLAQQGLSKSAAQTPLEFAQQLNNHPTFRHPQAVQEISYAYVRWRYGGEAQNLSYLRERLRSLKQRPPRAKRSKQYHQT